MFYTEEQIIAKSKEIIENQDIPYDTLIDEYKFMAKKYEVLLADLKFLTKVSDRLQNRMNTANESLVQKTKSLEQAQEIIMRKNRELNFSKQNLEEAVRERTNELKEAYNDLLAINKELDTFVYRASHDIKGPIARLIGLCNLGLLEAKEDTSIQYFHMLSKTAKIMNAVLGRLLSVNTIKHKELTKDEIDISGLVNSTLDKIISENDSYSNIDITIDIPNRTAIDTDESILHLMLQNIFELGVKSATHENIKKPQFNLFVIPSDTFFQVFVSYNGIVIPNDYKQNIFNMFYRTSNHEEISGMELYIAKLAAKKLGGDIELMSSTKLATTFKITLPKHLDI